MAHNQICELGELKEIDVRKIWKHEQYDFSEWMAEPENIDRLNDILGLTLVDVSKEAYVGAYRCDIVAKDESTGTRVVIENQLEASNHDHLGKIITYASGLDAGVVVWIVKRAREEHRSAIEWLNNNTTSNVDFFLIEVHAYKIGNSLPAVKFEVVEMPNGFIKTGKASGANGEMSKSQSERLEFWTEFNDCIAERGKPFNIRKATTDHWYNVSVGTSEAAISITLVNKENYVGLEFYISNNKDLFDSLYAQREKLEEELGMKFEWQRLDKKKASRALYRINGLNFEDHSNYPQLMNQIIDLVVPMRDVFSKYV